MHEAPATPVAIKLQRRTTATASTWDALVWIIRQRGVCAIGGVGVFVVCVGLKDLKVFRPIVGWHPIYVMDDLPRFQPTPQLRFGNEPVFQDPTLAVRKVM